MSNVYLNNKKYSSKIDDEFYTQYSDIENELIHYFPILKNKNIYCNCDSKNSNFVKYFYNNFHQLELKSLTATCYKLPNGEVNYCNKDGILYSNTLISNGDFRNEECISILKTSDIIISNPPFSLKEEYLDILFKYNIDFIILFPISNLFNKSIFSKYVITDKIHLGYNNNSKTFILPNGEEKKFGNVIWLTNFDFKDKPFLELSKKFNKNEAVYFDNSDILNINKVIDIPYDYYDRMAVPVSFMTKYNNEQFEILGTVDNASGNYTLCKNLVNGKQTFKRVVIRRK